MLFLGASPGVRFVVYLGQVLEVKVSIDLGRADVGVSQQLLDAAQVVARFQQVGCDNHPLAGFGAALHDTTLDIR